MCQPGGSHSRSCKSGMPMRSKANCPARTLRSSAGGVSARPEGRCRPSRRASGHSSPLSRRTKGDAKHPSGSEDWSRLCGRKLVSLKKYSQYPTLWVPIKKAREPTNPHTVMPVYITHVSEVLKIRFYCPFLDVCFYWLLYLLPIGCLSLAFSVSFFTDCQCVQKTNGDCWKFHLNIHISKKNLDFYLTPYTKLIKYGS